MKETLHCQVCGDVIGVYEPLVAVAEGQALETSQAAEPHATRGASCFHRACYGGLDGELSAAR